MRRDNWVRDAGVAGSNPATPTNWLYHSFFRAFSDCWRFPSQPRIPCLKRNINMRSRGAIGVRGLLASPSIREGAGNAGCLLHPRSRVQCGVRCAHEHTGTAGALRHSLRNGLTAYAALSLETNSSCLHPCRLDGSTDPVGSNSPPAA
jgi:hypothetical protein